jgi:hypothetical protein
MSPLARAEWVEPDIVPISLAHGAHKGPGYISDP